jgi:hypothetical protein
VLTLPLRSMEPSDWALHLDTLKKPERILRSRIAGERVASRSYFPILNGCLVFHALPGWRSPSDLIRLSVTIRGSSRQHLNLPQALTYGIGAETSFECTLSLPPESTAVVT